MNVTSKTKLHPEMSRKEAVRAFRAMREELARVEAERDALRGLLKQTTDTLQAIHSENRDAAVIVEAANHLREAANAMLLEWRMAAYRVGEQLADTGTVDYYLMSPAEWQAWALEAIDARRAEGKANVRGPREEAPAE